MRITSRDNTIIKQLLKLHVAKRRRERGEYLLYGRTLCEQALEAGVATTLVFTDESEWQASVFPSKLLVDERLMRLLADDAHVEMLAVCRMESRDFPAGEHVVVLDAIQDPGNLGTILRSAKAFGCDNIFLGEGCVDLYNIKVLRAAHGAHFSLRIRSGDLEEYLRSSANRLVTTFIDEENDFDPVAAGPCDIVFGNEGSGIRPSLKALPHGNLKLEIAFESLNVAIAASIILYTTFRKIS